MPQRRRLPKPEAIVQENVAQEAPTGGRGKALVFISHDSRDANLAEAFADLLTDVSAGMLKSFRASDQKGNTGIPFGAEWYRSIMVQLADSTDVVALLTPKSIARPWILYEAGVAKGKLDTTVLGVALGATLDKVSTGPFGQFQNCGDDEASLTKLVIQLLGRNPDAAPREEAVRREVQRFREKVTQIASQSGKAVAESPDEEQGVAKLFEEVKAMVRDLPERVDTHLENSSRARGFKRIGQPPTNMLLQAIFQSKRLGSDPSAAAFVLTSILREEIPWISEPGFELYKALRSGSNRQIDYAHKQILDVIKAMKRVIGFAGLRDSKHVYMVVEELPELVDNIMRRYYSEKELASNQASAKNDASSS